MTYVLAVWEHRSPQKRLSAEADQVDQDPRKE